MAHKINHRYRNNKSKTGEDKWNYPEGYFRGFKPYKVTKEYCSVVTTQQWHQLKQLVERSKFTSMNEAIKCWGGDHGSKLTDRQVGYLTKWLSLDKNLK